MDLDRDDGGLSGNILSIKDHLTLSPYDLDPETTGPPLYYQNKGFERRPSPKYHHQEVKYLLETLKRGAPKAYMAGEESFELA